MTPQGIQALGGFSEGDQIPENLSILTYTEEEEEVLGFFGDGWDEQAVSRTRSSSVESMWSSCSTPSSLSVLGVCTTPTTQAKKVSPRRVDTPLRKSVVEPQFECSLPSVASVPTLYRPSQLGIDLFSSVGNQLGAEAAQ